jgi:2-hydroxy-3-oxopropionate reductase
LGLEGSIIEGDGKMKIGFIGLGIMGRPMALNLLRGGYDLCVYSRRREAAEGLIAAGARFGESPAAVAAATEVVFTIVSDTRDVREVLLGPEGVAAGAGEGVIAVDMSTINPQGARDIARQLKQKGIEMLDAPVSGGETGAINGTLSIMVGGEPEAFRRVEPLLKVMGKNVVYLGPSGAGQVTKACNQIVTTMTIAGVAEALVLAEKSGVDPSLVREALLGGFAYSKILEVHGQRMIRRDFQPGFKIKHHSKDMRIVLEEAHEKGVALPGLALVSQYVNALMGQGRGELDSSALYLILEKLNERE